jgi:hypothetical protein
MTRAHWISLVDLHCLPSISIETAPGMRLEAWTLRWVTNVPQRDKLGSHTVVSDKAR